MIEIARETVAAQLWEPETANLLADLPQGDPDMIRRPDRPSYEWPGIEERPPAWVPARSGSAREPERVGPAGPAPP